MSDVTIPAGLPGWIQDHVRRYLESDGADGHMWDSSAAGGPGPLPTLLLTTTGRRTGQRRLLPLIYGERGRDYVIVGSKGGFAKHPAWYLNLVDDPEVSIQVGPKRMAARARTARGGERAELWEQMRTLYPPYDDYQKRTEREIPVIVLEPAP